MQQTENKDIKPSSVVLTPEEEQRYDEMVQDWISSVVNPEERKKINDYHKDLQRRTEKFYADLSYHLHRLTENLNNKILEDPDISAAIRKHFMDQGQEKGWSQEEINSRAENSKRCLTSYLHGKVVNQCAFHAVEKKQHHNDVASIVFFETYFERITDKDVRKACMKQVRKRLREQGRTDEDINKILGMSPPIRILPKFIPWRNRDGKFVKRKGGFTLQQGGLESKVWDKIKKNDVKKASEMVELLCKETGLGRGVIKSCLDRVGDTIGMYSILPSDIRSRMTQIFSSVQGEFKKETDRLALEQEEYVEKVNPSNELKDDVPEKENGRPEAEFGDGVENNNAIDLMFYKNKKAGIERSDDDDTFTPSGGGGPAI